MTPTLPWLETELLTREENLVGLRAVNRDVIGQAETLETRGVQYAIRIPANTTLELEIEDLWSCTPGRPSRKTVGGKSA